VLTAQHLLRLGAFDVLAQFLEAPGDVCGDVLPRLCPFEKDVEVIAPPLQRAEQREVVIQASPALHDLLRLGLIVPEGWIGDRFFDIS